ncbi:MAG: bifunctional methylenetetrahydrofolate dehydrogenase/methenyltetrahydrofolate cyclohydrolase FolD [Oscillospiraceae bacterium]|nr:bifunctional methylenetetrahydrofolate dehydrogenase/methenyltetrahydrofolate cyclohydrolase FolD [Oscillospiraceae bacterium]
MAQIIDGKAISAQIKEELKEEVSSLKSRGIQPGLAVIIVGSDPASRIYVNLKKKDCEELGILSKEYALPKETTEEELLGLIGELNADPSINGILVQLPVPEQIDENKIIAAISPEKDVDAFHAANVGKIMIGSYSFLPCTPAGCMELIASTGVDITGKNCVVVGRSNIVGKPMAMLLLHKHGTVTIAHSKTKNLKEVCAAADILVAAVGVPKLIKGDMIKPGAVVIDVGTTKMPDGKLCGDVDFEEASKTASFITPVPGGVGPMTRVILMKNTVTAAKLQNKVKI